ncbi:MAG: efflux RND transporter permease subunit [Candidatus Eisenbacteria bacterium]|uniref:Efflux RND transporter permease subunit n=1 Tax=Eiseniibacteriota bacterium TaxID=2212470 RepID=A0A948RXU0_UNCEI|nr:efflux RND transporter permease subunit [Candidatus Eisenbacteria bacterium]MBU1948576.1 efflux RND transporter permease subunit [Candidatus Eisenbacteria bacterium]MBU2691532.1 efflux RND transporter permease subunit [Candidatus Eisenbacteria bacterium]
MIRFFINHPVATWMLFAALMICGAYALPRLNIEAMPETELPSLTIHTRWNGASPSAVQRSITIPIEEAARKVHGIEELTSRSSPGRSQVTVSFRRDTNLEFARLEISEQLGAVRRNLPSTAGQPVIEPYVPEEFRTEDFFTFSLISTLTTNQLREEAEAWLVPRLLSIQGVADAEMQGGSRPLVKVLLDLELMERYNLTADGVYSRIEALDDILPAGAIRRSGLELSVSVKDSITLARLSRTTLRTIRGQPITLTHIAEITPSFEDPAYFVRINGKNVIQAVVAKRSGQNAVSVSRRLRSALPDIEKELPFPVTFEIDEDQGKALEGKLHELVYRSLIILGLLFVLLAIALRRVRLTAIVIFSILLAIVICLSLFYFFGISVNFITISGLTVCFGMLLDNSILVLDAIHRRLAGLTNGKNAREALVSGTREVAFPILATTLTTVVAFLSFIFLSGRLSLYYVPLAVSIGIAMLASIFVAFCWIPVALRNEAQKEIGKAGGPSPESESGGGRLLLRWCVGVLGLSVIGCVIFAILKDVGTLIDHWAWCAGILGVLFIVGAFVSYVEKITAFHLRFWWYPIVLMLGLFAGGYYIFRNEIHQGGFWRQGEEEQLGAYIERPVGTDVLLSSETMKLFEAELLPVPEGVHMKSWSWENRGYLEVKFEPELLRSEYPELFRNRLILLAEELGGMFIWIDGFGDPYLKGGRGGGLGNSRIKITGYNSKVLDQICDGAMTRLNQNRRVRNIRIASGDRFDRAAADESVIFIHRDRLVAYHLSVGEVLGYLRRLLGIETPWHMIVGGKDQRLMLSFSDAENIQYEQVIGKTMTTPNGEKVRLADLITLEMRPVIGSINREDQKYSRMLNWEYIGTDRMRQHYINDILDGIELPYGYTSEDVSGVRMTEEEEEQMRTVLILTLVFIFMTLAALFESVTLPMLVIISIPMALTGVVGLFWITDSTFDSSAKIGLVLLFGIVVNNAILLINRFRLQLRELVEEKGYGPDLVPAKNRLGAVDLWRLPAVERKELLRRAICDGTRIQLRSILLTSGTTIAGLLPLLIKITDTSEGKDIWENLALSSIGGLTSSTVLIISAIPAIYWVMSRFGWVVIRLWHRVRKKALPEAPSAEPEPDSVTG